MAIRLHKIKGSSIGQVPNQPRHKKLPTKNQKKNCEKVENLVVVILKSNKGK